MQELMIGDLLSLEQYHRERTSIRHRIMQHKVSRRLALGNHLTLYFEDRFTIQYQVQEMLRTERIFETDGIQDELDTYNPLIPDGDNWKATCMIEYSDETERRQRLKELIGIENRIWLQVSDRARIPAIADEDLDRSTEDKTSAVHFLRFQLPEDDIAGLKHGERLKAGVDHPAYSATSVIDGATRASLIGDLD